MLKATSVFLVAAGIFLIVLADAGSIEAANIRNGEDFPDTKSSRVTRQVLKKINQEEIGKGNPTCGAPPVIEGAIAADLEVTKYNVGTNVTYQCSYGYISRGSGAFLSFCKIDEKTGKANWTIPLISCVSRSCGDPGYVPNARRIGNLFTFPNKVEFECEDGYKLRGLKDRYCQTSGEWSGRLPTCELIYCSKPPDPANGRVRYFSLEYGSELRYECNKGFDLKNHQPRFCTSDGTWSNNEPECIEITCKPPDTPVRGSMQLIGDQKAGSIALYFCDEDTTMVGASTSKCLISGDWTFDPPKCMSSCKVIDIKDGAIGRLVYSKRVSRQRINRFQIGESIKHNETAIFVCKEGFEPSIESREGMAEVKCNDGLWNKPMECNPILCLGDAPSIRNGYPVINSKTHGSEIWYQCNEDYWKSKTGNVVCNNGNWKGPTPVCSDSRCYLDVLDFPGLQTPQTEFLNTSTSFKLECKKGYKKNTRKMRVKCSSGRWDIDKNPCDRETCDDDPPQITNGNIGQFARQHGSVVQYECDEHFDMVKNSTVRCVDGKWEGEPPFCKESAKNADKQPENLATSLFEVMTSQPTRPIPIDVCSCAYDYDRNLLTVTLNNSELIPGDKVKKGQTVSLNCLNPNTYLLWPNGMRNFGHLNLTCKACEDWKQEDLPTCETVVPGDSVTTFRDDKVRILRGGDIELTKSEAFEINCWNAWGQPVWWYPFGVQDVRFTGNYIYIGKIGYYTANMNIDAANAMHAGNYSCLFKHGEQAFRDTKLVLRVAEPEVQCPELSSTTEEGNFIIRYDNDRKVQSTAFYSCADPAQRIIGGSNRTCLSNGQWTSIFPSCEESDVRCPELSSTTEKGNFIISYDNDRKVQSTAIYSCADPTQRIIGGNSRMCLSDGQWTSIFPSCEDITCRKHPNYRNLLVSYTNKHKVNSIATFSCNQQLTLIGSTSSKCRYNGTWSNPWPTCGRIEIQCPELNSIIDGTNFTISYENDRKVNSAANYSCADPTQRLIGASSRKCLSNGQWTNIDPSCVDITCWKGHLYNGLEVSYTNDNKVNSIATFRCPEQRTLVGNDSATCLHNGAWSNPWPRCEYYITCPSLGDSHLGLEVSYSYGVRVGSVASFDCLPPKVLHGNSSARCLSNGTWSNPSPTCENPRCSVYTLLDVLPEGVTADLKELATEEFVPYGSEVELLCEDKLILLEETKAKCQSLDKWEVGNVQCVPGCRLSTSLSPHLTIEPEQKKYRFGDFIFPKCPPGQKLSNGVERIMCLGGNRWSDDIPNCEELPDTTSPSNLKETRKTTLTNDEEVPELQ